jgi:DNA-binding transcriptional LysR family regulator
MDRLDLRLVEYFVAVAEELHFSRAAERLHIAQPSLSQQIRRLEQQLGVRLLERTSRSVQLTPAGEALLREGRRTLEQSRRAVGAARAAGQERITVGFYGSAGGVMLARSMRSFTEAWPTVEVSIRDLLLGSLDQIITGEVDVAFTRLLPGQADLALEVLAREPRVAALPASDPLASRASLEFADLGDRRFIVNPAFDETGPPARWLAEQRRHGLPGKVAAEAASIQEILTLVASGQGVCLLPGLAASQSQRPDVTYVPVRDADPAVVSLAWRRENSEPATHAFIACARMAAGVAEFSPSG